MRKTCTKKEAEYSHAKARALERYGLEFSKKMRDQVISDIIKGKATFIDKQSNRVSVFEVKIYDKFCVVVYDKERKEIVTFLPPRECKEEEIEPVEIIKVDKKDPVAMERERNRLRFDRNRLENYGIDCQDWKIYALTK